MRTPSLKPSKGPHRPAVTGDNMGVKGLEWWEQKLDDIDADDGPKGRADHPLASAERKRK